MTPADEHHVVDMTYIPRKMRKKKLQDEDGKGARKTDERNGIENIACAEHLRV